MGTLGSVIKFFAFQQGNDKHKPNEDAYSCTQLEGNNSFAVADGVSRSVYGDMRYPLSALPAAEEFCMSMSLLASGISVPTAFALANTQIILVNEKAGIAPDTVDYLGNDYICCEGAAGVLEKKYPKKFSYGYIGDCGILVYDDHFLPVFLSDSPMGIAEQFREGFEFKDKSEQRIFWRQKLRNHPDCRFMTYGALTGEASALSYMKTGSIDLEAGDTVIMFSDGIYPFIFDHRFRRLVASLVKLEGMFCQEVINMILGNYIMETREKMQQRGVGNLDDDKTFIALTVVS